MKIIIVQNSYSLLRRDVQKSRSLCRVARYFKVTTDVVQVNVELVHVHCISQNLNTSNRQRAKHFAKETLLPLTGTELKTFRADLVYHVRVYQARPAQIPRL